MDGLENSQHTQRVGVAGVLGSVERDANVGLSGEIVDLIRTDLSNDAHDRAGVGQVAVVQLNLAVGEQ